MSDVVSIRDLGVFLALFLEKPDAWPLATDNDVITLSRLVVMEVGKALASLLILLVIAGVGASAFQNLPQFVGERIRPQASRICSISNSSLTSRSSLSVVTNSASAVRSSSVRSASRNSSTWAVSAASVSRTIRIAVSAAFLASSLGRSSMEEQRSPHNALISSSDGRWPTHISP